VRLIHLRKKRPADLAEFLGKNVQFGAAVDEMSFLKRTGALPVVSADPYLHKLLVEYCEEALARRRGSRGPFQSSVENAIVSLLPHGKVRADEIARRLGVGQRTFARRLSLEGLTFTDLLRSLKFDLAIRYLADRDLSISQVAWLLGYQEVANFSHAFKRWSGKTPREARGRPAS
jgi:AraC-like DNA-binding protein